MSCFCKKIYGVDNSSVGLCMAAQLNDAGNITWIHSSMCNEELFGKSSIDLVTSIESIEHISREDIIRFVKICFDILKPRGYLVGTTTEFRASSVVDATPWHKFELGLEDFEKIVSPYFESLVVENFRLFPQSSNKQMGSLFILQSKKSKKTKL